MWPLVLVVAQSQYLGVNLWLLVAEPLALPAEKAHLAAALFFCTQGPL